MVRLFFMSKNKGKKMKSRILYFVKDNTLISVRQLKNKIELSSTDTRTLKSKNYVTFR